MTKKKNNGTIGSVTKNKWFLLGAALIIALVAIFGYEMLAAPAKTMPPYDAFKAYGSAYPYRTHPNVPQSRNMLNRVCKNSSLHYNKGQEYFYDARMYSYIRKFQAAYLKSLDAKSRKTTEVRANGVINRATWQALLVKDAAIQNKTATVMNCGIINNKIVPAK